MTTNSAPSVCRRGVSLRGASLLGCALRGNTLRAAMLLGAVLLGAAPTASLVAQSAPSTEAADDARTVDIVSLPDIALPALPSVDEALRRLAEAELLLTIDRDPDGVRALLDPLRLAVVTAEPFAAQADLLARDLVLRVQLALLEGDGDLARALTMRFEAPVASAPDAALRARLDALANGVLDDPRVAAMRDRLHETSRARPVAPDLKETVEDALRRNDEKVLVDLGSRAMPVLIALLHPEWEGSSRVAGFGSDPAYWLVKLDPVTARSVFADLLDAGRFASPARIILAFGWTRQLIQDGAWLYTPRRAPRFLAQDWLQLVERCLRALPASMAEESRQLLESVFDDILGPLVDKDALPEGLARAAVDVLLRWEVGPVVKVMRSAITTERRPTAAPLFEGLLEHRADAVRFEAARVLADIPTSRALRRHVDDVDPRVRLHLALSLRPRQVYERVFDDRRTDRIKVVTAPTIDAEAREILRRLARDDDGLVRAEAMRSILTLPDPLEREVYVALARDPSADVRMSMAQLPSCAALPEVLDMLAQDANPVVRLELAGRSFDDLAPDDAIAQAAAASALTRLAGDPDPAVRQRAVETFVRRGEPLSDALIDMLVADPDPVLRRMLAERAQPSAVPLIGVLTRLADDSDPLVRLAVGARLVTEVQGGGWKGYDATAFLALLEKRVFAASDPSQWTQNLRYLDNQPEVIVAITRWALTRDGVEWLWRYLEQDVQGGDRTEAWLTLPADELMRVALEAARGTRTWGESSRSMLGWLLAEVARRASLGEDARLDAWRPLLVGDQTPASLKLDVLTRISPLLSLDDVDLALGVIGDPAWRASAPESRDLSSAAAIVMQPAPANAFVSALLARDDVEPSLLRAAANTYVPDGPGGEALTAEVLRRWYGPTSVQVVAKAIVALGTWPDAADSSLLGDALFGAYPSQAIAAMSRLKDARHLPLLARYASENPYPYEGESGSVPYAISIIESFLDDQAVDVLLQLAGSGGARLRARCMEGVKSIQDYLLARRDWERRLSEGRTRADAVGELLGMLDGDDALLRAEAVRALGALGAVEQMPKVIALLRDADPSVAAAAREALDRLHAVADVEDS